MSNLQLTLSRNQKAYLRDNIYNTHKNMFAFVYNPIKKNEIKLDLLPETCREVVCDQMRSSFTNKKKFDIKRLRLIVYNKFIAINGSTELSNKQEDYIELLKVDYRKKIAVSIKIVNIIEKEFKWPLTKIYLVECKQLDKSHMFYYFTASKKWVKSPSLFSLFMLLIRISLSLKKHTEFRTLDGLYRSISKNSNTVDINHFKIHHKRYLLVLRYYDRLFGKTSMRDLYLPHTGQSLFTEGINYLCNLYTKDLNLHDKFVKILEENKMLEFWEKDKLTKRRKK